MVEFYTDMDKEIPNDPPASMEPRVRMNVNVDTDH
jgi:hypothetical protein